MWGNPANSGSVLDGVLVSGGTRNDCRRRRRRRLRCIFFYQVCIIRDKVNNGKEWDTVLALVDKINDVAAGALDVCRYIRMLILQIKQWFSGFRK